MVKKVEKPAAQTDEVREYEIALTSGDIKLTFTTNERRLARAAKQLALENGADCVVTRTAKREVKFAGV